MFQNNERLIGIAVSSKLSPDASIAMEGWIDGDRKPLKIPENMKEEKA